MLESVRENDDVQGKVQSSEEVGATKKLPVRRGETRRWPKFNAVTVPDTHSSHQPLSRITMDFSTFNSAEQAHMSKVIEKKQVCYTNPRKLALGADHFQDARLLENVR